MVQQNPIPTSGMVLMAILDDGAFRASLMVGLVSGRGHILCHTGWRLLKLLATITHFAIFSKLSHLRYSGL